MLRASFARRQAQLRQERAEDLRQFVRDARRTQDELAARFAAPPPSATPEVREHLGFEWVRRTYYLVDDNGNYRRTVGRIGY